MRNKKSSSSYFSSYDNTRLLMIACALISRFVLARLIGFASESFFPRLGLGTVGTNLLLLFAYLISYAVPILIIVFLCPADEEKEEEEEEDTSGIYHPTIHWQDRFFVRGKTGHKLLGAVGALGICFLAGALGELVSSLFARIGINPDAASSSGVSAATTNTGIVFYVIYAVILAPLLEELFFRTALLRALEKDSRATAIVISALFFALSHSPSSMIYAFAAGLVFAALAFSYGSSVSFGAHFCNNLISVTLLLAGNSTGYEIPCYAIQCAVGIACAIAAIVWICFGCFGCLDSLGRIKWRTIFFSPVALALVFAAFTAFSPLF